MDDYCCADEPCDGTVRATDSECVLLTLCASRRLCLRTCLLPRPALPLCSVLYWLDLSTKEMGWIAGNGYNAGWGTGVDDLYGVEFMAVDPAGKYLWLSDDSRLRRADLSVSLYNPPITSVAGASSRLDSNAYQDVEGTADVAKFSWLYGVIPYSDTLVYGQAQAACCEHALHTAAASTACVACPLTRLVFVLFCVVSSSSSLPSSLPSQCSSVVRSVASRPGTR